ncbi:hypothetical protein MN202_17040 [Rheinheimera muenzenbergensis]|uniref:Uncharacterized protein n=1 Tax=Rheinheimera muenzenbergensis TaxID=1193628 RepID=A0ABU8CBC2_9GAMM
MDKIEQQIETLRQLDINENEARNYVSLLDFIDAPHDLKYLAAVLENVCAALERPLIAETASNITLIKNIIEHRSQAYSLLERLRQHRGKGHFFRPMETNVREALSGYITNYPFYAVLFINSDVNPPLYNLFHQVILLLPHLVDFQSTSNCSVTLKLSDKKLVSLIFRKFSEDQLVTNWYASILNRKCDSLFQLCELLKQLEVTIGQSNYFYREPLIKQCEQLITVLKLGLGDPKNRRDAKGRSGGSPTRTASKIDGFSALTGEMLINLTLPDIHDEENVVHALWEISSDNIDYESIYSGEEEQEQETSDIYVLQAAQPIESYVQAFHGKRVSSAIIKRIERQNNYLPLSLQGISPFELQQLLIAVSEHTDNIQLLVQQLIVLTMLYTASDFQRAREIINNMEAQNTGADAQINFDGRQNCWLVPAFEPQYKLSIAYEGAQQAANVLRLIATPLCLSKFSKLTAYLDSIKIANLQHNKTNVLSTDIDAFIKNIGTGTLTQGRISNCLLTLSCATYGQATTALLFNREPPGSSARNYYTSLETSLLQKRYQHLLDIMAISIEKEPPIYSTPNSTGWIGARYRPEITQVANAVSAIKQDLARLLVQLTEQGIWIEFHNLYSTYQILCQSLLTGMRPITTPIVKRELLIDSVGVFIRKEKSREDEFNTRHIPVCQTVLDLTNEYEQHVLAIRGRLSRKNIAPHSPPALFFLEATGRPQPFQTLLYQKYLNRYINLPPNLNRRLLRNFLEESRVSHEVIDVALGHANLGEQYWGDSSTLSMCEIRLHLAPHMDKFRALLGIKAIAGIRA